MSKQGAGIEILMAVRNGEAFLREQIDSILRQTDGGWHLTISDDGSEDGSSGIISEYALRFPDRIEQLQTKRLFGNARDHFFYLMKRCTSEYMMFCDQDDVWYPDKVKKTRNALAEANRTYGADTPILVFSDQTPTDEDLNPLALSLMRYQKQYSEHFDYRSILMQNVVTGGAMGINRALAVLAGSCDDVSGIILHDWWLAAVAARFGQLIYINEPLSAYRQHSGNVVGAKAVGSPVYIWERISSIDGVRESIVCKKTQAEVFRQVFEKRLNKDDEAFLSGFAKKRSGLRFYMRYAGLIHGFVRKAGMLLLG